MPINNTPITDATPLADLLSYAQNEACKLFSGEEFIAKDLFLGYEWERIAKRDRSKLGAAFFAYAQKGGSAWIEVLGKTPQNQQRYRRK